jgi:hypothetical protein
VERRPAHETKLTHYQCLVMFRASSCSGVGFCGWGAPWLAAKKLPSNASAAKSPAAKCPLQWSAHPRFVVIGEYALTGSGEVASAPVAPRPRNPHARSQCSASSCGYISRARQAVDRPDLTRVSVGAYDADLPGGAPPREVKHETQNLDTHRTAHRMRGPPCVAGSPYPATAKGLEGRS